MQLTLRREDPIPLYRQIGQGIRALIETGSLGAGARLPTVRALAQEHGVTRLTVQNAYAELQEQGWIESRVGCGSFVSAQAGSLAQAGATGRRPLEVAGRLAELLHPLDQPDQLMLGQAAPCLSSYPTKEFKACLRWAAELDESYGYGPIQGEDCLREELSRSLLERRLVAPPEQILVTAGAQQAIDLALRSLTTAGDVVALEVPAYPGVLESLRARAQRVVEVPVNRQGLDLEALSEICQRYAPRLLYTVPSFHNPTGALTSVSHRQALLELADRYDFTILEDDVYGLLAYDGPAHPPLKSLDGSGRVVYITSFSKNLAPSLRVGAVVASADALGQMSQLKQATDLICSSMLQRALAEFLRRGCWATHLQTVTRLYRERRDAAVDALQRYLPDCIGGVPGGGFSIWLSLPPELEEFECWQAARQNGLLLARGQAFYANRPSQGHLRLSFSTVEARLFESAIRQLSTVLRTQQRSLLGAGRRVGPLV